MGCLRGRGTGQGEGRRGQGSDGFTAEGELAAPRCQPGTQEHPGQTRWERHHVGQAQAGSPPGPQLHPWGVVRHLWRGRSRRAEKRTRRIDERSERPEGNVQKFSYSQAACVFLPFLLGKILSCFFKQKASHRIGTMPRSGGQAGRKLQMQPASWPQELHGPVTREERTDRPVFGVEASRSMPWVHGASWLDGGCSGVDGAGSTGLGQRATPQALLSPTFTARGLMAPVRFIWEAAEGGSGSFTAPRLGFSSTRGFAC